MKTIEYYRQPTKWEIKFGEGDLHYISLIPDECTHEDGSVKRWVKKGDIRYYCVGWYKGMSI